MSTNLEMFYLKKYKSVHYPFPMFILLCLLQFIFSQIILIKGCPGQAPNTICSANGKYPVMATAENLPHLISMLKENCIEAASVGGWNGQCANLVLRSNGALAPYDAKTNNANAAFCTAQTPCNPQRPVPCVQSVQVVPISYDTQQVCQPIQHEEQSQTHQPAVVCPTVEKCHKPKPCFADLLKCGPGERLCGQAYFVDPCQRTSGYINCRSNPCFGPYYGPGYGPYYGGYNNQCYDPYYGGNYYNQCYNPCYRPYRPCYGPYYDKYSERDCGNEIEEIDREYELPTVGNNGGGLRSGNTPYEAEPMAAPMSANEGDENPEMGDDEPHHDAEEGGDAAESS